MRLKISSLIIFTILFFISQTPIFPGENPKYLYGENGFYINGIDTTVDPGQDFYQYAVGNWLKNNPIPDEYSYWGSFLVLHDNNQKNLQKILDDALNNTSAQKGSIIQKVGDFYYTGMDTLKIMEQGIAPIQSDLDNINSMKTSNDFYKELAYIQMVASNPLFSFGSGADAKNSDLDIAQFYQSGLGLPDRDYYVNDDDRSKDMREKYVIHVANMFKLLGEDEETAKSDAKKVMEIETRLAKVSMTQVEQRDPNALYNKMSLSELQEAIPDFNWTEYFNEFEIKDPGAINIGQPKFFKEIGQMVKEYSINDWKPYFRWKLISGTANYLTDDFVNEKFDFYGKYLNGSKVLQPRWKRVLSSINGHIGDALGQLYVKDYFPPEAKQKAHNIVMSLLEVDGRKNSIS